MLAVAYGLLAAHWVLQSLCMHFSGCLSREVCAPLVVVWNALSLLLHLQRPFQLADIESLLFMY